MVRLFACAVFGFSWPPKLRHHESSTTDDPMGGNATQSATGTTISGDRNSVLPCAVVLRLLAPPLGPAFCGNRSR
jgi:hypothetical protein